MRIDTIIKLGLTTGLMSLVAACAYPRETRYSVTAAPAPASMGPAYYPPAASPAPTGEGVRGATDPAREDPAPRTAPTESIEGGSLDGGYSPAPASPGANPPRATSSAPMAGGATYVVQAGDTVSGVGRRFRTPVANLISLNNLGDTAAIRPGQRLSLPDGASDGGFDPYATGPAPSFSTAAAPAPAPRPAAPAPVQPAPAAPVPSTPAPTTTGASAIAFDWPVRGELLRRFGPAGMGERNNGVNIGASAGRDVVAAAAGQVGYVGDDLAGQGLTVLIKHDNGWRTVYGHLGSSTVRDGQQIRAGQVIGTVGTTAGDGRPSIHFETWHMQGDEPRAVDPVTVLPR